MIKKGDTIKLQITEKNNFLSIMEIYDLINVVVATAKIKTIRLPHMKIRPFMHCIMCGLVGSTKSSILYEVCDKLKVVPNFNLTTAALMGSVDSTTGEFITPAVWDSRNSVLAIDDFHVSMEEKNVHGRMNVFLSLLENPSYQKKMGYRCNNFKKRDKDLFCVIDQNVIKVKTRFVLLANTMMPLYKEQRAVQLKALRTRCLILPYYPNIEEIKMMAYGEGMYEYKKYAPNPDNTITKTDYGEIVESVYHANIKTPYFLRTIGDLCRAFAVIGNNDKILNNILKMKSLL